MSEATDTGMIDAALWASRFINNTNRHVFLTGKAGTGKTTFLKAIREYTHKNTIVAAPTGIAAINAGGVTLHSLLQLPFGAFLPTNKLPENENITTQLNTPASLSSRLQMHQNRRRMLQEMELLIIDEVSMLRADLLDAIDLTLRLARRTKNKPFGGVQILFIGDLFQLPPVVKEEEWSYLKNHYSTSFFFDALALRNNPPVYIELQTVYRQVDDFFIDLLNHFRDHCVTSEDINLLNTRYDPGFQLKENPGYIFLTTHNWKADKINKEALEALPAAIVSFEAEIEGEFGESQYPVEFRLDLKEGAQVMFIKNDPTGEQQFFNGKIGTITCLEEDRIEVGFPDGTPSAVVTRYIWENKKFALSGETNEIIETVTGTFSHYPLKLAWAITVHKSQGLTFEKAVIDVAGAFAPGQIYVALSRLVSLEGLVLSSRVPQNGPEQDHSLESYVSSKNDQPGIDETLEKETQRYVKESAIDAFSFGPMLNKVQYYCESYVKDEKRSVKQLYKTWAYQLKADLVPVKDTADRFIGQVRRIISSGSEDYLAQLSERIMAARKYFGEQLSGFSLRVFDHITVVKGHTKSKIYQNELKTLEQIFFRQLQLINKVDALIQSVEQNRELSSESEILSEFNRERDRAIRLAHSKEVVKAPKQDKAGSKNQKFRAEAKTNTKEVTFRLFSEGKSLDEIAAERGFARSTIEGHLIIYVADGKIPVHKLVSEEKIALVEKAASELETSNIGAIKDHLGEAVSWAELRFVQAHKISQM